MKNKKLLSVVLIILTAVLLASCGKELGGGNKAGKINFLPYEKEDKWGYANDLGEVIVEPKYDEVSSEYTNSSIAPVQIGGKWGFVDRKGELITPLQYDEVAACGNEFIKVKKDGKWGFIDHKGKVVAVLEYDEINSFVDGLAIVNKDGKYGFIDEKGKIVIEPQYTEAKDFEADGFAEVCLNGKYGFINKKGKYIIEPMFDEIDLIYVNGIASYRIGEKYGYFERSENGVKIITEALFDSSNCFDNHVAQVEVDGKIGFINESGEYLIQPIIDFVWGSRGIVKYEVGEKCGYLEFFDGGVKVITDAIFDSVYDFNEENGLAMVASGDKYGWINKNGEFAIDLSFTNALDFSSNGLAAVAIDNKWGFINTSGEFVIAAQFIDALEFAPNGLAAVAVDSGWGYINESGSFVIEPKYSFAHSFEDYARVGDSGHKTYSYYQAKVAYFQNGVRKNIMIDENGNQTLYYWPS